MNVLRARAAFAVFALFGTNYAIQYGAIRFPFGNGVYLLFVLSQIAIESHGDAERSCSGLRLLPRLRLGEEGVEGANEGLTVALGERAAGVRRGSRAADRPVSGRRHEARR